MAKKSSKRKNAGKSAEKQADAAAARLDGQKFGTVLYSLTYDYDERDLSHASSYLGGERLRMIPIGFSVVSLVALIAILLWDSTMLVPAMVLVVISVIASAVTSSWDSLQIRYANSTTLGMEDLLTPERRHVVVGPEKVFVEIGEKPADEYPLDELRVIYSDSEFCVAGFQPSCYVYIPHGSMSENRYRALVKFLKETLAKNKRTKKAKSK